MSKNKGFSDTSANRYSLALYELAKDTNSLVNVEINAKAFLNLISNNKDFKNILSDFRGELNAIVSMPTKMSDAQIKEIESMLNNVLKKKVNLDFKFDPSLISGAKLQIGSLMVDDTAKAKFNKILNNL